MNDPISDMLTRIRNANRALLPALEMPHSKMKESIAGILKREGYIAEFAVEGKPMKTLKLKLKYQGKKSVIEGMRRVSTPGLRRYVGADEIPRVRGGLGVATVAANAVFAAVTGSSIASAAVFTKIATPEMLRHGYTPRFAVGVVAGSSVLGMLIPPSLLFIVYGFLAEQSVGDLFLAGIVPGLVLAAAMALAIVLIASFWPAQVGGDALALDATESVRSAALKLAPIMALIVIVLGGIYGGVFTPTESGAAGALGALLIALARRKLGWRSLWDTMVETGYVTVSILFLILGARIFGQMLAMSGLPQQLSALAAGAGFGLAGFVLLYVALVVVLGCMLDSVSIMVITLPFAIPVVKALGGDLVWFGVVAVVAVEIGLLTPPFGISVYVVKSTLDDQRIALRDIFAGAFPFVICMMLVTLLLVFVPQLSLVFK
jgi:tripartite ATP-independent transporter DctM subunit